MAGKQCASDNLCRLFFFDIACSKIACQLEVGRPAPWHRMSADRFPFASVSTLTFDCNFCRSYSILPLSFLALGLVNWRCVPVQVKHKTSKPQNLKRSRHVFQLEA